MNTVHTNPSTKALDMLQALRRAIRTEFEKKQRLGQYVVVWQDGKAIRLESAALRDMLAGFDATDHA